MTVKQLKVIDHNRHPDLKFIFFLIFINSLWDLGKGLTYIAWRQLITTCISYFQIDQTIKDVGLEDQKDTFAKDLSGGQKRKLSVAIALIGDPKVGVCTYTSHHC